jgi:hypothetical protein
MSSSEKKKLCCKKIATTYGSFTLAKFVSETVSDRDMKKLLPLPPWVTRDK